MSLTEQHIQIILRTIGPIDLPNYERVYTSICKKDEFSDIEITPQLIQNIHEIAKTFEDRQEAVSEIYTMLARSESSESEDLNDKAVEVRLVNAEKQKELGALAQVRKEKQKELDTLARAIKPNIVDYMVIKKKYAEALVPEVKKQMAKGWIPHGGVSFAAAGISPIGDTGNAFIQAMVKIG